MIRPLAADDAEACDAIIGGLPEWFGMDEGIAECAAAVRIQRGLVAEADGAVVGFVTHRLHYPQAGELTWLAVPGVRSGRATGGSWSRRWPVS